MVLVADQTHAPPLAPPLGMRRAPWGSWGLGPFSDREEDSPAIKKLKNGAVWTAEGELRGIWGRWWPYQANLLESWILQRWRRLSDDHCWLYYNLPGNCPGFLSLRFIHSGKRTRLKTIDRALSALEDIAKLQECYAIVCSATNVRLSDRLMKRYGFERHAFRLPGYHYIKRFRQTL